MQTVSQITPVLQKSEVTSIIDSRIRKYYYYTYCTCAIGFKCNPRDDLILEAHTRRYLESVYPDATAEDLRAMDNVCIICREEMQAGNACKKLPCSHIFHKNCLRTWFQRQQTCPTCRTDILQRTAAPAAARPAARPAAPPAAGPGGPQQQPARGGVAGAPATGAQLQAGPSGASTNAAAAPAAQPPFPPGLFPWMPQFATQQPHLPPPLNADNNAYMANNPFFGEFCKLLFCSRRFT